MNKLNNARWDSQISCPRKRTQAFGLMGEGANFFKRTANKNIPFEE